MLSLVLTLLSAGMEGANREARDLAMRQKEGILRPDMLDPSKVFTHPEDKDKEAEAKAAAQFMMDTRATNKVDDVDDDTLMKTTLKRCDEYVNNPDKTLKVNQRSHTTQDTIHECIEESAVPKKSTFCRTLKLNVEYTSYLPRIAHMEKERYKVCFKIKRVCTDGWRGFFGTRHSDDSSSCTTFDPVRTGEQRTIETYQDCGDILGWRYYESETIEREKEVVDQHERLERTDLISEEWIPDNPTLFEQVQRNACNIVHTQCLEGPESRKYYSAYFPRDCWKDQVTVEFPAEAINTCIQWRKKGCYQIFEHCNKYADNGQCLSYTKRYRCPARTTHSIEAGQDKIHCIDGGSLVISSPQNEDMVSSLAQLSVLGAFQNEQMNAFDPNNVQVFKGTCLRCTKNVLDKVLYDCCGTLAGFALTLNLIQCKDEAIELAKERAKGLCHRVGSFPNKLLGLFDSSETHVYCCFPSKLTYVLQKEARRLLRKGWGTPFKPNCSGLTMDEIQGLDFSKMDLSPVFDDLMKTAKNKDNPLNEMEGKQSTDRIHQAQMNDAETRMREKMNTLPDHERWKGKRMREKIGGLHKTIRVS